MQSHIQCFPALTSCLYCYVAFFQVEGVTSAVTSTFVKLRESHSALLSLLIFKYPGLKIIIMVVKRQMATNLAIDLIDFYLQLMNYLSLYSTQQNDSFCMAEKEPWVL